MFYKTIGRWEPERHCVKCHKVIGNFQRVDCNGVCPYCGNDSNSTIISTYNKLYRNIRHYFLIFPYRKETIYQEEVKTTLTREQENVPTYREVRQMVSLMSEQQLDCKLMVKTPKGDFHLADINLVASGPHCKIEGLQPFQPVITFGDEVGRLKFDPHNCHMQKFG